MFYKTGYFLKTGALAIGLESEGNKLLSKKVFDISCGRGFA